MVVLGTLGCILIFSRTILSTQFLGHKCFDLMFTLCVATKRGLFDNELLQNKCVDIKRVSKPHRNGVLEIRADK